MTRLILGSASLLLVWAFCAPISAQPKEALPPKGAFPRDVRGAGDTLKIAQENALREAEKTIAELVKMHGLQSFKMDKNYVRQFVVAYDSGKAGEDVQIEDQKPLKQWILPFRTDRDWWGDIERQARAAERQTLASRGVLGLSILLLAGFGYLRLDEFTQRRYTTLLRAAGVGLVATAIGGWWWVAG